VKRRLLPLVVACVLLPAAACSGGDDKEAQPSPPPPPPAATTLSPPPAPKVVPKDFLTGVAPRTTAPLIGIKVDNAPTARPYLRGLEKAAIVYTELVEGGSTRFLALYTGAPNVEVGPIRSVRESDFELLRQYGPVALGFSGGNDGVLATFRQSVSAGALYDVSFDAFPADYRLAERRVDARNFFTRPSTLAPRVPSATPPKDVGLRFAAVQAGSPLTKLRAAFSDRYSVTVQWSASKGTYSLVQSGAAIHGAAPQNVIVQRVKIRGSRYRDVNGTPTPYTDTVGSGAAIVLRDGKQVRGTWSRANEASGTRFRDAAGKDIALHPGRTWILLVPTTGSIAVQG
jgi:hypothetical protein